MPFLTWDKFSFHKCNAKVTVDEMQYKVWSFYTNLSFPQLAI